MNMTLGDVATLTGIGSAGAGVLFLALMGKLGNKFITRKEFEDVIVRVRGMEEAQKNAPDHRDFDEIRKQMSGLSRELGEVKMQMTSELGGVRDLIQRIDRMVELTVKFQMQRETQP